MRLIVKWLRLMAVTKPSQGKLNQKFFNYENRVSVVNYNGHVLYDKYVKPLGRVTDYRTWVSGVQPFHLLEKNGAITFALAK